MRNIFSVLAVFAALASTTWAQTNPAPAPTAPAAGNPAPSTVKIGIFSIQRAIVESTQGKKAAEDLQKRFTPRRTELETMQNDVARLQKQLEDGKNTLNDETRANLVREIERKTKDFNRKNEDANAEFQQAQEQFFNSVGGQVMKVLDEYARKNSYDVVLDVSTPQSGVLWATNRIDITDEIIRAFNGSSGGAAPAAGGGGATGGGTSRPTGATGARTTPPPGTPAPAPPPATKPPATKPPATAPRP